MERYCGSVVFPGPTTAAPDASADAAMFLLPHACQESGQWNDLILKTVDR